jgi:hypothetical protein
MVMGMREKLIEICQHNATCLDLGIEDCVTCPYARVEDCYTHALVDHLIKNGVAIPVRCKECKKWKEPWLEGQHLGRCMKGKTAMTEPNDFCSYGERKDND